MKKRTQLKAFLEAWVLLHLSRLSILFMPFQQIAARLGVAQFETSNIPESVAEIQTLCIALRRAIKYAIHKSNCFDQAVAAMYLCKRRKLPATIYFGLTKSDDKLQAHAWLRCGVTIITGYGVKNRYTVVAWFGKSYLP